MMISSLIVADTKFNFIIDELNGEKLSQTTVSKFLTEQDQDEQTIKILAPTSDTEQFTEFMKECRQDNTEPFWNVILPPLSDFCCYHTPPNIFQFINILKRSKEVKRIFLWASTDHLPDIEAFLLGCLEYMSDLIVHLHSTTELSIIIRKFNGISNKRYNYKRTKDQFLIEPLKSSDTKSTSSKAETQKVESTFKIELEEEELIARNALKLPYEKNKEADIVYEPEEQDDFDDEDPDEDLCI